MSNRIRTAVDHEDVGLGVLPRPRAYAKYTESDFIDSGDELTFVTTHVLQPETSVARWLYTAQDGSICQLPLSVGEGTFPLVRDVMEFTTELGERSIPITILSPDETVVVQVWEY